MSKKILYVLGGIFAFLILVSINSGAIPTTPKAEQDTIKTEVVADTTTKNPETNVPEQQVVIKESNQVVKTENTTANSQYTFYSVVEVVDGDTVKLNINGKQETLRLIGLDTPETLDPRKPVQCFGKEASNKAKELLNGKKVRLEKDSTQGELDKYGRTLAYIYREDGLFYNEFMIKAGYAHEYTYNTPYKYQAQFKADEKYARENQLGLWSPNTCNGDTTQPATSSSTPPAQPVNNTQTTGKYYTSSHYTAKYYYPEACDGWKSLSESYLKVFNSLSELLVKYPSRTLSPNCP